MTPTQRCLSACRLLFTFSLLFAIAGCGKAVHFVANVATSGDPSEGMTYYLGGAGPIGNVGSFDVPHGLQEGGYTGAVEVITWQGLTHAGDQMNLARNREKGTEFAASIRTYRRAHPNTRINIIALSAGTGVATWALEYLPEGVMVDQVVFLGCSLSSRYDMTRALRRIQGQLYVLYAPGDPILAKVVWYTGTVDRAPAEEGVAGLRGFRLPAVRGPDTERQYSKVLNVPWRIDFSDVGYNGGHIDCTSRLFVRTYIAPVIMGNDEPLVGEGDRHAESPLGFTATTTSQPVSVNVQPVEGLVP